VLARLQKRRREETGPERNYDETKNFDKPLALVRGQRLQAASDKLQATSLKLDKIKL